MMSFDSLFRFRGLREELVLIIDVGSASVGGALVLLNPTALPLVIYAVRREMKLEHKTDFERLVLSMRSALDEVMSYVQKEGLPHLKFARRGDLALHSVYCILGAPWYASQSRTLRVSKEKPFRINRDTLSEILNKDIQSFEDRESKRYFREGIEKGEMDLIEKETLQIKLNGYEVKKPYNRLAKDLEMLLFLSVVPSEVIKVIHDRITRVFHVEAVTFHSLTLTLWGIIRDIWHNEEDYLIIDISGEITEISLVRGGVLLETATIPLGKNFFIRKIARHLKISSHEAFSLLNLYITEKGSEEATKQIETVLAVLKKEWSDGFQDALRALSEGLFLPTHVFLTADSFFSSWFSALIKDANFSQGDLSAEPFSVTLIDYRELSHVVRLAGGLRGDPFLLSEVAFVEKMHRLQE